jgi:hypothetical protein
MKVEVTNFFNIRNDCGTVDSVKSLPKLSREAKYFDKLPN